MDKAGEGRPTIRPLPTPMILSGRRLPGAAWPGLPFRQPGATSAGPAGVILLDFLRAWHLAMVVWRMRELPHWRWCGSTQATGGENDRS